MKPYRSISRVVAPFVLGLVALSAAGCYGQGGAIDGEPVEETYMSFEDFEATVYQEPETGLYIVDGDTPIETREELMVFYERHIQKGALIVNTVGGVDDKWSPAMQANLTYCISTEFGDQFRAVENAMTEAVVPWHRATYVRFTHKPEEDSFCNVYNPNVVFSVSPTSNTPYHARAFFPSSSWAFRNILIDSKSFGNIAPLTLDGVLRHEIGHVLGFRHEHTRPEAATCFEDASYRALTTYDSASVMHYPDCNGTNTGDLILTQKDIDGAMSLYGSIAMIYQHASYQGMGQPLYPGAYDMDQLSFGNDTVSSAKVPSGWTVKLYQHAGFTGAVKTLTVDTSNVGIEWNDITSSIIVTAP